MEHVKAWKTLLKKRLPERTYRHCLSVAEMMERLAKDAGITPEQARTAGLLHDLCKNLNDDEVLAAAENYGLVITPAQKKKPSLLHGPVAAEEARHSLGVTDEEVLDAIRFHTVGRPHWGAVGLALYFADFTEPLRTYPVAAEARKMLKAKGYREALRFVTQLRVEHIRTKYNIDPATEAFHAWMEKTLAP